MATDTNHDNTTGAHARDTAPAGADVAPTPTADPAVTVEVVPLDTLTPLTDNPRTHTSRRPDPSAVNSTKHTVPMAPEATRPTPDPQCTGRGRDFR